MTFTYGAKSIINAQTNNPITLSHTTVTNTKLLVVGIITKTTTARTGGAPTFNGVTMTQVGSTVIGAAECTAELWYLSNPSIGTYNVSVPNAGALTITVIASSYVDASVTGATLDVYNSTNVTGANPSLSVTTGANGEAIVDVFGSGYTSVGTGNQTLLYSTDEGVWSTHAQYALQANAGSITFTWTQPSDDVAFIVGAFKGITVTTYEITKLSDTRILKTQETSKLSDAKIILTYEINKASDARILKTQETSKLSDAKIILTYEINKASDARILKTQELTKLSDVKVVVVTYTSYGLPFQYNAANWTQFKFYFEVYMRAISGTAYARLLNETDNLPVDNSVLSTTETTMQTLLTNALTLINGKPYRAQFGKIELDSGAVLGAKLIAL